MIRRFVVDLPVRWLTEFADAQDDPWEPFLRDEDDDHLGLLDPTGCGGLVGAVESSRGRADPA